MRVTPAGTVRLGVAPGVAIVGEGGRGVGFETLPQLGQPVTRGGETGRERVTAIRHQQVVAGLEHACQVEPAGAAAMRALVLAADAGKVRPGEKGNLIVAVFAKVKAPAKAGPKANPRGAPLTVLPAIPYDVVPEGEETRRY